jgi:hypothetical protein
LCAGHKNLSFYFSFYFEGSPLGRRSLGSYAVREILLYFYVPMFPWKDFLMGRIRKNKKHKEERHRSGKFKKTRRKEWRKERKDIFRYMKVPILVCSRSVGNTLGLLPSYNLPSGESTCMGTSPTTLFQ